jgi:glycosyltransferase involved in cell wall biosynthesis
VWDLVAFYPARSSWPPHVRPVVVDGDPLRFAASLWLRARRLRYDDVVVCAADAGRADALRMLLSFVALIPARRRRLLDRHGTTRTIAATGLGGLAAAAVTPPLLLLARAATRLVLALCRPGSSRRPPVRRGRRTAIVIPILPDLSHTFVYREALALAERHPEWDVLVLERGTAPVLHREAEDLAVRAQPVSRPSPNAYLVGYLRHCLMRPRTMAALIRSVAPHTASFVAGARPHDVDAFLRLQYLDHSNHVAPGLVFAEHLRRADIGYVHVWGATYPALRALVAHRLLGVRVSLSTFVDFEYETPFHMLPEKLDATSFVVACTAFCASRLHARHPVANGKVRVLHHALPRRYPEEKPRRDHDGRSRLVYVGRFVPKKGIDTLLHACRLLMTRGVAVSCHLYGGGDEELRLRDLARALDLTGAVHFEGAIPNQEIYRAMNTDDVFVCPSRPMPDGERDGIPVTLLEAMAAGITVVTTRTSGIPELVDDAVNGYLVAPDDPGALADVLARVLTSPAARQLVADAARRTVRERFALEDSADTLDRWISREIASTP